MLEGFDAIGADEMRPELLKRLKAHGVAEKDIDTNFTPERPKRGHSGIQHRCIHVSHTADEKRQEIIDAFWKLGVDVWVEAQPITFLAAH